MAETPRLNLPKRYQLRGELGRGGMGVVYRVVDLQFQRPLALKVTLPHYVENPEAMIRFQREAQLTGSLQHPGIPPVVDRGTLEDGTPYFSLKLVEGDTLASLLQQRLSPEEDLLRFLGIFEHVCQAVGYAHSQGIIHRDLKPENVMVGKFGEVQVMDWGMAKRVEDSDIIVKEVSPRTEPAKDDDTEPLEIQIDSETVLKSRFDAEFLGTDDLNEEVTLTRAGQVLGTLAYMPPEQARGEQETLDVRADVFALGGILCKILTGRSTYSGDDHAAVYRQVLMGNLSEAYAALDKASVDAELIALCRSCLSPVPGDRPVNASAVAEAIRRYEEMTRERLEVERTERAAAEARAIEGRKRQRITAIASGLAVLLLSALSLGGWWYQSEQSAKAARQIRELTEQAERDKQARADIASALERVPVLREQYQFEAAEALMAQAEGRLELIAKPGELSQEVMQTARDLRIVKELDLIRLEIQGVDGDLVDRGFAIGPEGKYAQAYERYGLEILSDSPELLADRITESRVSRQLIDGLDAWNTDEFDRQIKYRLLLILSHVDPNPVHHQLRDPAVRLNPARRDRLIRQLDLREVSPAFGRLIANLYNTQEESGSAREFYRTLLLEHPGDFWLHYDLAFHDERFDGSVDEALGHYQAALAVRPDVALVYTNMGHLLRREGRLTEAEQSWREALRCDPQNSAVYVDLGDLMGTLERTDEAESLLRKGLEIAEGPLDLSFACHSLGAFLQRQGRFTESLEVLDRGLQSVPSDYSMYAILQGEYEHVADKLHSAELAKPLTAPRPAAD